MFLYLNIFGFDRLLIPLKINRITYAVVPTTVFCLCAALLSLSVCLSDSLCVCLCPSVCSSDYLSVCPSVSLRLSVCLCLCRCLCLYHYFALSLSLSVFPSISFPPSPFSLRRFLPPSLPPPLSLSLTASGVGAVRKIQL